MAPPSIQSSDVAQDQQEEGIVTPYTRNEDGDDENNSTTSQGSKRPQLLRKVSSISLPNEQSGLFGTSSNMVNSIVGAGIVGMPYAINNAGFIMGVFLLCMVAYLTDKSLRLIVDLASFHPRLAHLGVLTYEDLMKIPFGQRGFHFVMVSMSILAYGSMVAYLLVIKDTLPAVLGIVEHAGGGSFVEAELVMLVSSLLFILPLCMMRDMASLSFTSLLSVVADIVLVVMVVLYAPVESTLDERGGFWNAIKGNLVNENLFIGLGVLSSAMACQHSAFIMSNSLKRKTPRKWAKVTFRSITLSLLLSLMIGVAGYLAFLENTKGDILNNFHAGSLVANLGRGLLAFTMFFSYPMDAFVLRHVLVQLFFDGDLDGIGENGNPPAPRYLCGLIGRKEQITLTTYLLSLIPALLVDDLGPVLALAGALGASMIAYVAAGMAYLGINGDHFLKYCNGLLIRAGCRDENHLLQSDAQERTTERRIGNVSGILADISSCRKPWWWHITGFPIWIAIAARGAQGMEKFLEVYEEADPAEEDEDILIGPKRRDYFVSIFLIAFGAIAAVVGTGTVIIVEIQTGLAPDPQGWD